MDHFQPRSRGGSDALENLVYCCPACNEYKGDYWQPTLARRILHPQRDDLAEHFILTSEDTLSPLTDIRGSNSHFFKRHEPTQDFAP